MNKNVQKLIKCMEEFTNSSQFDSIRLERIDCFLLLNYINKLQQKEKMKNISTYINTRMPIIKEKYNKVKDTKQKEMLYNRYCELRNIKAIIDGTWDGEKIIDKGDDK